MAIDVARWLSPDFAVWMDGWILEQINKPSEPPKLHFPVSFRDCFLHQLPPVRVEADVHAVAVREIRRKYPSLKLVPGMPPMPDASQRDVFFQMGYTKGQPDLLIPHRSGDFVGLALEFKHPGFPPEEKVTEEQRDYLATLEKQGWKTFVGNNVFDIVGVVGEFCRSLHVECDCGCGTLWKSKRALAAHKDRKRKFLQEETERAQEEA